MRVRVYHDYYGCESGCCGHVVELDNKKLGFQFTHPYGEDRREFAEELAREVIGEMSPQCIDTIDWSSLEYDDVKDE